MSVWLFCSTSNGIWPIVNGVFDFFELSVFAVRFLYLALYVLTVFFFYSSSTFPISPGVSLGRRWCVGRSYGFRKQIVFRISRGTFYWLIIIPNVFDDAFEDIKPGIFFFCKLQVRFFYFRTDKGVKYIMTIIKQTH